jgi:hypothetical protein
MYGQPDLGKPIRIAYTAPGMTHSLELSLLLLLLPR